MPIKVVSERLGHSTPAFTMATYQHVLPGATRSCPDLRQPPRGVDSASRSGVTHDVAVNLGSDDETVVDEKVDVPDRF